MTFKTSNKTQVFSQQKVKYLKLKTVYLLPLCIKTKIKHIKNFVSLVASEKKLKI